MIGQAELINKIGGQIGRGKFPRFSIFIGEKGSGKKTLAKELMFLGLGVSEIYFCDIKVDNIREVIESAYKLDEPILYVIPDCDNMSNIAANSLLKVTEEPPKNAYFVLTCESIDNLLPTIKSRGVTYMLAPYTYEDKCDYIDTHPNRPSEEDVEFILDVASTIGDIQSCLSQNIREFRDYVNLVIDNIAEVSDSNAFKIGDKIAFKDEKGKYDLRLFWKAFSTMCVDLMTKSDDSLKYARAIAITGDYSQQLYIKGINKSMLFDQWIVAIREEWL